MKNLKSIKLKLKIYLCLFRIIFPKIRLFWGISVNVLYIFYSTLLAFLYKDSLLFAVTLYYIFSALMRYALLPKSKNSNSNRSALTTGILLIPTVLAMAGIMISTLSRGIKKNYSPLTLIPQSFFVIFCLVGAVIRLSRHKSHLDGTAVSIDVISLSAALFSVFNLVNYLSRIGIRYFGAHLTLLVGLISVASVFSFSVILISKGKDSYKNI